MKKLLVLLFLCVLPALAAAEGVSASKESTKTAANVFAGNFPVYMQVCNNFATENPSCGPLASIGSNMRPTDLDQQIVDLGCSSNGNGMYYCPASSNGAQMYATNSNAYIVVMNYGPPWLIINPPENMVFKLNVLIAN